MNPKTKLVFTFIILILGVAALVGATTILDPNFITTTGPVTGSAGYFAGPVTGTTGSFSAALTGTTLDTGQGANELYDMNQNVMTTSAVTFTTVDTGQGANELYDMNQNVQTTDAVTFATVNTGQGANELYDMDQDVTTVSAVTFASVTLGGVTRTTWSASAGTPPYYDVNCFIFGSNYEVITSAGNTLYNSSSAAVALQTAYNWVTRGVSGSPVWKPASRVLKQGSVYIGPGIWDCGATDIYIPSACDTFGAGRAATIVKGTGTAVMRNMWANTTYGSSVNFLRLDANSAAYCFLWSITNGTLPSGETYAFGLIDLNNLHFRNPQTYALYISSPNGSNNIVHINNIRSTGVWFLDHIVDSHIQDFQCSKLILKDVTASHFHEFYIGGGYDYNLRIYDGSAQWDVYDLIFTNGRFDNPSWSFVSIENYAENIDFVGCQFSNLHWTSTNNTYSGIILGPNTNHINIKTCTFSNDLVGNVARTFKYVIEQQSGSYGNIIVDNAYNDNQYNGAPLWDKVSGAIFYAADYTVSNFEYQMGTTDRGLPTRLKDGTFTGEIVMGQAGEALALGEVVYVDSNGKYYKTDANSSTTMYAVAICTETISADGYGIFLLEGYIRVDAWSWTIGSESPLFVSWTAGELTQDLPSGSGNQVQIIGYAIHANIIWFDPDSTVLEIT